MTPPAPRTGAGAAPTTARTMTSTTIAAVATAAPTTARTTTRTTIAAVATAGPTTARTMTSTTIAAVATAGPTTRSRAATAAPGRATAAPAPAAAVAAAPTTASATTRATTTAPASKPATTAAVTAAVAVAAAATDPQDAPPRARRPPPPGGRLRAVREPGRNTRMTSYDVDMASGRRTILLVEDEPAIAEPLAETLTREGFHLEVAGTAADALDAAARVRPDLILLDLMLPDGSGFNVCREVRRESQVPIIMLTARGDEADRVIGLELGADDYVVKPFSAREVTARVRAVLRRTAAAAAPADTADGSAPVEVGDVRLDPATRSVTKAGTPLDVTRKEFDLLALLMGSAGSVVTRERLIDEVWDVNWFGSTKTLDVHVSGLRKKLGDDSAAPRYIHTVRGVGFMFAGADEAAR